MKIEQRTLVAMVEGIEGEAELPEAIDNWLDQIEGDPLEPTATEMALAGAIANAIDSDDLEDQLGELIQDLNQARHNLENQN